MATITCRDCGAERKGVPSNTRYCKRCRILTDLDHWRKNTRSCRDCRQEFAPLNRGDHWCSTCHPGLRSATGQCALAPHEGRYVDPALPVCATCARDPKQRKRLIQALERGQAARRKTNPKEATP